MKNYILEGSEKENILKMHKGAVHKELFPYTKLFEETLTSGDPNLDQLVKDEYVSGGGICKDYDNKLAYSASTKLGNLAFFYGDKTYKVYKKDTKEQIKKGKFKNSKIEQKLKDKTTALTSQVINNPVTTTITNNVNKPVEDPIKKLGIKPNLNLSTPSVNDLANKYGNLENTKLEGPSPQEVFNTYLQNGTIFKRGDRYKSKGGKIPEQDLIKLNQYFTDNNFEAKIDNSGDQAKDKAYGVKYVWKPKEIENEIQETFITDKLKEILSEQYESMSHNSSDLNDAFSELVDLLVDYGYEKSGLIDMDYEELLDMLYELIINQRPSQERKELEMFYEKLEELLLQNQKDEDDDSNMVYENIFDYDEDTSDIYDEYVNMIDHYYRSYDEDLSTEEKREMLEDLFDLYQTIDHDKELSDKDAELLIDEISNVIEMFEEGLNDEENDHETIYEDIYGSVENVNLLLEAEYKGRKVQLGKIMQGDVKKFKVFVKNDKGKVVKVNFGFGGKSAKGKRMTIKKNNPARRKAFRARHRCDNPGPRWKPRYWACRTW